VEGLSDMPGGGGGSGIRFIPGGGGGSGTSAASAGADAASTHAESETQSVATHDVPYLGDSADVCKRRFSLEELGTRIVAPWTADSGGGPRCNRSAAKAPGGTYIAVSPVIFGAGRAGERYAGFVEYFCADSHTCSRFAAPLPPGEKTQPLRHLTR
jgi:hypothetical protein